MLGLFFQNVLESHVNQSPHYHSTFVCSETPSKPRPQTLREIGHPPSCFDLANQVSRRIGLFYVKGRSDNRCVEKHMAGGAFGERFWRICVRVMTSFS